jgi:hypothetical protein
MSFSNSVQFDTAEKVLTAYQNQKVSAWVIYCNRQLLFFYEDCDIAVGEDFLQQILNELKNSPAVYTLCLYKKVPADGITNKTPYNASFNFRLGQKQESERSSNNSFLEGEHAALKMKVEQLEKELEDTEEMEPADNGIMGFVNKILEKPEIQQKIIGFAETFLMGLVKPKEKLIMNTAAINGAPATEQEASQRVTTALQTLAQYDNDIVVHLEKLAQMATNETAKFKMLIGML